MKTTKSDSKMFDSKQQHDAAEGAEEATTCNLDGREVPLGTKRCINHDSYTCGKNGWYKDGGKC